jgi:hypothetical protein
MKKVSLVFHFPTDAKEQGRPGRHVARLYLGRFWPWRVDVFSRAEKGIMDCDVWSTGAEAARHEDTIIAKTKDVRGGSVQRENPTTTTFRGQRLYNSTYAILPAD